MGALIQYIYLIYFISYNYCVPVNGNGRAEFAFRLDEKNRFVG